MTDNVLQQLERTDKWYLSCGDGILWAPPFPQWLHRPGLWDEAHVYYHPFQPLFAVALVDATGNAQSLDLVDQRWRPDHLVRRWQLASGVVLTEETCALPGGRFVSMWSPPGDGWPQELRDCHLVAFSAQPAESTSEVAGTDDAGVTWHRLLVDRRGSELRVRATLTASGAPNGEARRGAFSWSEGASYPDWRHTPFWEHWGADAPLPGDVEPSGDTGLLYVAVMHSIVSVKEAVRFILRLAPVLNGSPVRVGSETDDPAVPWREWFNAFPRFRCSNPYFERYYNYRIYGLGLNRLQGDAGKVRHPAIAEGIGYFHVPITYSAQCHMRETRWMNDPAVAHGSLLNFIEHQKSDGSFHGRIYTSNLEGSDFYHANWGDAVLAVDAMHADHSFLERAYLGLGAYARWLLSTRDPEASGMYDVVNHFETGQEFMSRYQEVDPNADADGWTSGMRLKGIDVTVYAHRLFVALGCLARRLGLESDTADWSEAAERSGHAILHEMWDDRSGFFHDVDPRTMKRTAAKAGVGFYPLFTDLLAPRHVTALLHRLNDPGEFGTPFPVPSSSCDDPRYCAEPFWKGQRRNCPWNGRVWPMVNSHVIDGLLHQWHAGRRDVGEHAARLLESFVRMMFHDGDLALPNCFEHYNPETGRASVYRGIDDYQHSWVLDLILRGVGGLEPHADGLTVHPLPLELDEVALEDATVRGRSVSVYRRGKKLTVVIDGVETPGTLGVPMEIRFT